MLDIRPRTPGTWGRRRPAKDSGSKTMSQQVSFIDMMLDPTIKEVWCETHDDITLLFELDAVRGLQVEFVQVKADESHQLWSLAKLTHAESLKDGKVGKSILENLSPTTVARSHAAFESSLLVQ